MDGALKKVGLRHLLVHQSFGVDEEIAWDFAVNRCPELIEEVTDMLSRIET